MIDYCVHRFQDICDPLADPNIAKAEEFTVNVFIDRVAARADIDESEVPIRTHAVFKTIAEAGGDLQTAREQLPPVFDLLFEPGPLLQLNEFLATIQERSDIDSADVARDAATATLATLGEVLTGGQAADIATYLPTEFKDLLTGSDLGTAMSYSTDKFIAQVAQRESLRVLMLRCMFKLFSALSLRPQAIVNSEIRQNNCQMNSDHYLIYDFNIELNNWSGHFIADKSLII